MGSFLWKLLRLILVPLAGIALATYCNLAKYVTFIPEEYKFEAGITVYFALIE